MSLSSENVQHMFPEVTSTNLLFYSILFQMNCRKLNDIQFVIIRNRDKQQIREVTTRESITNTLISNVFQLLKQACLALFLISVSVLGSPHKIVLKVKNGDTEFSLDSGTATL